MATLTPKLSLKKPVPDVETDWAFRLNETIDLLDDSMFISRTNAITNIVFTNDGAGNSTFSGVRDPILGVVTADRTVVTTGTFTSGLAISSLGAASLYTETLEVADQVTVTGIGSQILIGDPTYTTLIEPMGVTSTGGTFLGTLNVPLHAIDPSPSEGDVWINTTTSGLRWRVGGTTYESTSTAV